MNEQLNEQENNDVDDNGGRKPEPEVLEYTYKPYDHPIIRDEETGSMSDEEYERGVQFFSVEMSKKLDDGSVEKFTVAVSQGLAERGGLDFVMAIRNTHELSIQSFMNYLVIQIGVGGFYLREDEVAKLIKVPQIKYKKQYLPPYVAIVKLSTEAESIFNRPEYLKALEVKSLPKHTLVLYDQYGVHPQDEKHDHGCAAQFQLFDFDLELLETKPDKQIKQAGDLTFDSFANENMAYSPGSVFISNPQGSDETITNDITPSSYDSGTFMDLEAMGGDVSESELDQIAVEDEAWDKELASMSPTGTQVNSDPNDPLNM